MRRLVGWLLLLVLVVTVVLPALIARGCGPPPVRLTPRGVENVEPTMVRLFVTSSREVLELELEEYVAGVVAAEMPAAFHMEALKAGAVAARTYVARRLREGGGAGCDMHPLADICDDPAHHQAWASPDELRRRWGLWNNRRYTLKIARAVSATRGLILVFDGVPIDAVYHSTCGGRTEAAVDAWGVEVAYLRSVDCFWDGHSPRFESTVTVSAGDVFALGSVGARAVEIAGRTPSGRVTALQVGNAMVPAATVRSALGLNSTRFDIGHDGSRLVFQVSGFGHGVGLCQYGADGLGREGAEFVDILAHYYPGAELELWGHLNSYGHPNGEGTRWPESARLPEED